LPPEDWLKCQMISWAFQAFHCLGLLQTVAVYFRKWGITYRQFYERILLYAEQNPDTVIGVAAARARQCFVNLRNGHDWSYIDQRFGDIIWPPEEAGFLMCIAELDSFYQEINDFVSVWPESRIGPYERSIVQNVVRYQSVVLWAPFQNKVTRFASCWNIHEIIESRYRHEQINERRGDYAYEITSSKTYDNFEEYAREIVWYGRKGGRFRHTDIRLVRGNNELGSISKPLN
jgi:hypothetical protein